MRAAKNVDEFLANPQAYGMPTFDEFRRNKKKYLKMPTDTVDSIDAGNKDLNCPQVYRIEADTIYRVDSLEQAERIARDEGLSLHHDYVVDPQVKTDEQSRYYIEATFRKKASVKKRANW